MPSANKPIALDFSGLGAPFVTQKRLEKRRKDAGRAFALTLADRATGLMEFPRLPGDRGLMKASLDLAAGMRRGVEDMIVCGIGGSSLGFLALANALLHPFHNELPKSARKAPRYYLLDNADADTVGGVLDVVNIEKTLIVVISKSGGGGETIANFLVVFEELVRRRKGNLKKALAQVVAITDPKSGALRKFADEHDVASLPVPPNVGGRFSVLTPVGTFPAAMLGMDVPALMAGARLTNKRSMDADALANPPMVLALLLDEHYRQNRRITVFMPYANGLWRTADWFRQLWAESLGKARDRKGREVHVGFTPMAALGATDQHSQVQLYAEGPDDKTYLFLRTRAARHVPIPKPAFAKDAYGFLGGHTLDELLNLEGDATEAALAHFGRPTARISMDATNAHAIGQVLIFLELTTACVGALWNINAFDQPGVELGKILTMFGMGMEDAGDKVIDQKKGTKARELMERSATRDQALVFRK
ncbi:glucose-6-phosphate isomerase [bacterium]|nr:glucose-6-phosphate isomerase [bacterium]